jgi:acetyl esterase
VEKLLSRFLRAVLRLPAPVLRAFAGAEVRNDRGDILDLQTHVLLRLHDLLRFPKTYEQTPQQARRAIDTNTAIVDPHPPVVARIEPHAVPGPVRPIPLRVYVPRETPEPLPVQVYLHGGGHTVGSFVSYEGVCRALARDADCIVVAVDYRLAPEHPFPAAVEDAIAAFEGIVERAAGWGGDPERVGIGGDSAGGNIAAVVCQHLRDSAGSRPVAQMLIYPATDLRRPHVSHEHFAEGLYLEAATIDYFLGHYLSDPAAVHDPKASPLLAERFDELPPALVVTAGFDPLRDEGEAYAAALRDAGVTVVEQRESALIHGFVNMAVLAAASAARRSMGEQLGLLLRQR